MVSIKNRVFFATKNSDDTNRIVYELNVEIIIVIILPAIGKIFILRRGAVEILAGEQTFYSIL